MLELLGRRKPKQSDRFCLDEAGRKQMQAEWGDGGAASRIMVALESSEGSLSISELSSRTHVAPDRLVKLLPAMAKKGWITKAGESDDW